MASGAVWGIDIGQCALKALRCHPHDDPNKIVADAFDYIEYPKILSQPGSEPAELIADALKQFLSRNSVVGDRVAISVSGQAGLARFIKLPPVEAKKIPDIVRYEARQQIPFDLNDVIWDYQRMGGAADEEGFALETEIGLFAMKRDAVFRALDPFLNADIEVDVVQLTPLVLYNFVLFDQLGKLPSAEEYDPENPPESVVIVSLGTDATDLVITNGFRVWQRSIPLGGSHFTKALTRELKLTFAKAEHLKRNATAAADPKAVFQAMRPVFSDLLTELQRSISYFSNLDRNARIGRVLALGNAMKLPGLRRYLSQSLGYEIERLESFQKLIGPQVLSSPAFQENLLSFGVCYGLALQGMNKGGVHTNLLPKEITQDRLINRKKPWIIAAAAVLMLGCSISFAAYSLALGAVEPARWKAASQIAQDVLKKADDLKMRDTAALAAFDNTDKIGKSLVENVEGRTLWLELLKAVNVCLPPPYPPGTVAPPNVPISERGDLHISNLSAQHLDDVSAWFTYVKPWYQPTTDAEGKMESAGASVAGAPAPATPAPAPATAAAPSVKPAAPPATPPAAGPPPPAGAPPAASAPPPAGAPGDQAGPKGPGFIVALVGSHYHNESRENLGAQYLRETLIKKLGDGKLTVTLPNESGTLEEVSLQELGIGYPVLITRDFNLKEVDVPDPVAQAKMSAGGVMPMMSGGLRGDRSGGANEAPPGMRRLKEFDFVVQFCWQPKTAQERAAAKKAQAQK
jgi:type IV pilus assembly protein PilM